MLYGYIRVSTEQQNGSRQLEALKKYERDNGVEFDTIFTDKVSGKNFDRKQYQALKKVAGPGDVIVVKELDRLGRNYQEIKDELAQFKSKDITVRILDLPTFNVEDESLSELLNSLMIELLGYIAETERQKIQQRIQEGVDRAKAEGKRLGRPPRQLPSNFEKYYKKHKR